MTIKTIKTKIRDLRFRLYYLTLFKCKTYIRRKTTTLLKLNRPASLPYITGDGFRSIAQHVFDEIQTIETENVASGDVVFVRADFLHDYFKRIHPLIQNRYILISHNSDQNIDSQFLKYIDTKIIHWFAQNVLCSHEKITPIPIGIHLRIYDSKNTIVDLLKKHTNEKTKASSIYYAFSEETNTKRSLALKYLKNHTLATGSSSPILREDYYTNISNNTFNASPEGGGVDCHRTWESMYLKSIPVLERNVSTEYWKKIGLPVYLIDSWSTIDTIDSKIIEEFYKASVEKFNSPALYMEYWIDKITQYKHAR